MSRVRVLGKRSLRFFLLFFAAFFFEIALFFSKFHLPFSSGKLG